MERTSPLLPDVGEGEGDGVVEVDEVAATEGDGEGLAVTVGEAELVGVLEGVSVGLTLAVGEVEGVTDELTSVD